LIDNNKVAINTINENIRVLNITNATIIKDDAINALNNFINQKQVFDIIFLDPPYQTNELDKTLTIINNNLDILNNNSIIVCETEINIDYEKYNNLTIYKTRKYGQKNVSILKIKH
jgi:16S rRNA (guanine(966)-N(2))-methyltransferase RsmD